MKQKLVIVIYSLLIFTAPILSANEIINGSYIGWKKISDLSPHDKTEVWYHEYNLNIKGDKVIISVAP